MIHGLFSVKDKGADAFLPPFTLPTESMALREFAHCAKLPDHRFCVHSHDFSLYKLGVFDDNSGLCTLSKEPVFMLAADNLSGEA